MSSRAAGGKLPTYKLKFAEDEPREEWIALVSGLQIDDDSSSEVKLQMLTEFLTGEGGSSADSAVNIQRLVVVGNNLAAAAVPDAKFAAAEVTSKSVSSGFVSGEMSNETHSLIIETIRARAVKLLSRANEQSRRLSVRDIKYNASTSFGRS